MSELSREQVERMNHGLLRGDFNRALVNLIGHDLDEQEIKRTETFLDSFTDDSILTARKIGTVTP